MSLGGADDLERIRQFNRRVLEQSEAQQPGGLPRLGIAPRVAPFALPESKRNAEALGAGVPLARETRVPAAIAAEVTRRIPTPDLGRLTPRGDLHAPTIPERTSAPARFPDVRTPLRVGARTVQEGGRTARDIAGTIDENLGLAHLDLGTASGGPARGLTSPPAIAPPGQPWGPRGGPPTPSLPTALRTEAAKWSLGSPEPVSAVLEAAARSPVRPPAAAAMDRSVAPRPAAEFDRRERAPLRDARVNTQEPPLMLNREGFPTSSLYPATYRGLPTVGFSSPWKTEGKPAPAAPQGDVRTRTPEGLPRPEPPRVGARIAPSRPLSTYERAIQTVPGYERRGEAREPLGSPEEEMQKLAGGLPLARAPAPQARDAYQRSLQVGVPTAGGGGTAETRRDESGRPYIEHMTGGGVERQYSGGEIAKPPSTGDPVLDDLNAHIDRLNKFRSPPMSQAEGMKTYESLQKMMMDALEAKSRYMTSKLKPQSSPAEELTAQANMKRAEAEAKRVEQEHKDAETARLMQADPMLAQSDEFLKSRGLPTRTAEQRLQSIPKEGAPEYTMEQLQKADLTAPIILGHPQTRPQAMKAIQALESDNDPEAFWTYEYHLGDSRTPQQKAESALAKIANPTRREFYRNLYSEYLKTKKSGTPSNP